MRHGRAACAMAAIALGLAVVAAAPAGATPALRILAMTPGNGATRVRGTSTLTLSFSLPLATTTATPRLSPSVAGTWQVAGTELIFTPTGAYPPDGIERVSLAAGAAGVTATDGATLSAPIVYAFTIEAGSRLRAEQLLARLGYLPVSWRPVPVTSGTAAVLERALFAAPSGVFSPIGQIPHQLATLFRSGTGSIVFKNALQHFQAHEHLTQTGTLDPATWAALAQASLHPRAARSPTGFTYALANKALPETLTIWQRGKVVLHSLANTGIAASPTADGNYAVYLRLSAQVMTGVAPWGTPYSDPVQWVAYFHGSEAVHYISRYSYGYPQSFGCVELPYAPAEQAFGFLQLNTLISVVG